MAEFVAMTSTLNVSISGTAQPPQAPSPTVLSCRILSANEKYSVPADSECATSSGTAEAMRMRAAPTPKTSG